MTFPRTDLHSRSRFGAVALLLALASATAPARAASVDPLQSDACRSAVASMQVEEEAEAARHADDAVSRASLLPTPSAPLQDARRHAAKRCLAAGADVEPARGRFAQAPIVVEPVTPLAPIAPQAPLSGLHAPVTLHPLPSPSKRPDAVVSCDAGGCWASDGSRLQRVGRVLWGARGACTVQGASLQCP